MPTTTRFGAKNGKKNTVLAAARTLLWERPARIPSAEIDRNLLLTKWMTQTGTALDDLLAILQARDRTPQGLMDDLGLSGKMSESRRCKSMIGEQADREEVGAELANSFEHTHPEHFGSIGSPEQAGVRGRPGSSGDAGALRYSAVNKADMERRLKEAAAAQYAALGLPFPEDGRGLEQELREAAAAHHGALGLPFTEEDRDLEQNSREAVAAQDANDRSGPVVRASRQPTTTAYGEQSPAQAKHLQDRDQIGSSEFSNQRVSKRAGELWREESGAVKQHFWKLAEQESLLHSQLNPGYKYEPGLKKKLQFGDASCTCGAYAANTAAHEEA